MVSCARATRGLRRPSLDARSRRPNRPPSRREGLQARNEHLIVLPLRAHLRIDQATLLRDRQTSLEGGGGNSQAILLARRTRTMKRCSFDARSEGHSLATPLTRGREDWKALVGLMARPGESIAKQSEGRAGEKCLPVGGRQRAVEDQSAPIPER